MARPVEQLEHARLLDLAPAYITTTRSQLSATTPRSWVIMITPMPSSRCRRFTRSRICAWIVTSRAVGRLVGDQQLGPAREGERDHHPLPHAARELVRILAGAPLGFRDLHQLQHLDRALHRLGAAELLVQLHALGDLPADAQHRVERGHRLLEDHRDAVAADAAHLLLAEAEQVAAAVAHRARRAGPAAPARGAGSRAR
jgi:hypothetical protein